MEAYVKVRPGEDDFSIDTSTTYPTIHLSSPATRGKANRELVKRLSEILGCDVGIVSGHKSSRKKVSADISAEEFKSRLEEFGSSS
ncbi:MAG: DUF167 domain-containing protein [Candidatus Nanohaloarchaea archaeon]|nr:DUF167 domain-containing protein [Candidatus Nanohaloarchaea archaeon]